MGTKYKGKNVRISDEHHEKLSTRLPKKIYIGGWVEEAIDEKFAREGVPTLDRQDWPIKKETK